MSRTVTVTVTKPPGTAGQVSAGLNVSAEGPDRVRLSGATGHAPTDTYKVSIGVHAGWKAVGQLTVAGPDAVDKARLCADVLLGRLARQGEEHFGPLCHGPVHRYELPSLHALNFVLEDSLDGGGPVSLRTDAQGKTYALWLLQMSLPLDEATEP